MSAKYKLLTVLLVSQFIKELAGPYEGYPSWALALGWLGIIIPLVVAIGLALTKE